MSNLRDLPEDYDPELAFAALGSILQSLRLSYGFTRLGINATTDGNYLAEGWWVGPAGRDCASAFGPDASSALKSLCARKSSRCGQKGRAA